MRITALRLLSITILALLPSAWTQANEGIELVEVRKIWDQGEHNAFTDLIRFQDRWYCTFREGKGHVSTDGAIRVIASSDGTQWESVALLTHPDGEVRDPDLSITADGKLLLLAAASQHPPNIMRQPIVWLSDDGKHFGEPTRAGEYNYWLWRVDWNDGLGYGVGYKVGGGDPATRLYRTHNGKHFEVIVPNFNGEGHPNEAAIKFLPDDTALCLIRRDKSPNTGMLGSALPPYTDWSWRDLGVRIGGPEFLVLGDGRLLACVRLYDGTTRTSLCWIDSKKGTITEALPLPSGGDCSYAGMVEHDGLIWVSYYSSHEGKTSIYLAKVKTASAK